jgi:GH25 family lysozyme M1 (1,4-beta-N-acetylmuramidase)
MDTIHFVLCKATQGVTLTDPDFTYNWQRLQELRITRGAYHFFMNHDDPVKQAVHFLNTVDSLERKDLPLVVDIVEQSLTGIQFRGTSTLASDSRSIHKYRNTS